MAVVAPDQSRAVACRTASVRTVILRSVAVLRPRRLLIMDPCGDHLRGHKRMLAARDRGAYVRPVAAQRALIEQDWVIEASGVETHPVVLDTVYYRCVPKLGD